MTIPDPTDGQNILAWAKRAAVVIKDHERRLNSIRSYRPVTPDTPLAIPSTHPFQLLTRAKPGSSSGAIEGGIIFESSLFLSLRPNHKRSITGLLSEKQSSGWFDLLPNDAIWLELTFDRTRAITGCEINSWGESDQFDLEADPWTANSVLEDDSADIDTETEFAMQKKARFLLATTFAGDNGEPVVAQDRLPHLLLAEINEFGRPARFPVALPHSSYIPPP